MRRHRRPLPRREEQTGPAVVDEVEEVIREDQNSSFIQGKAVHCFTELTDILDYMPEGYDSDDEAPAKREDDTDDEDLPEVDEEDEAKLKNDESLKWDDEDGEELLQELSGGDLPDTWEPLSNLRQVLAEAERVRQHVPTADPERAKIPGHVLQESQRVALRARPGDRLILHEQVKEVYAKTGRTGTMVFAIRRASYVRGDEVVAIVDTPSVYRQTATVATASGLAPLLPRRAFDTHKGDYGRVGIVAGSRGYIGAAVMCAEAAVRGRRAASDAMGGHGGRAAREIGRASCRERV